MWAMRHRSNVAWLNSPMLRGTAAAFGFGLLLLSPWRVDAAPNDAVATASARDVHQMLMRKFEAMNGAHDGIFHDDITSLLAPYFPVGQLQSDTRKVVAEQKLGSLRPFMGTNDPGMGQMFVSQFDLVGRLSEHVYVVVDFDFDNGSDGKSRLKQMKAYLRASGM